jgi:hypothetical protein
LSTTFIVVERARQVFNSLTRTWDWYAPESKPLSRKKLRQMMPLNHASLTGYALARVGHRRGRKNTKSREQLKHEKQQERRNFSLGEMANYARQLINATKAR